MSLPSFAATTPAKHEPTEHQPYDDGLPFDEPLAPSASGEPATTSHLGPEDAVSASPPFDPSELDPSFKIGANELLDKLSFVEEGVMRRGIHDAYQYVEISYEDGNCMARSYNSIGHTVVQLASGVAGQGASLFDARRLKSVAKSAGGELSVTPDFSSHELEIVGPGIEVTDKGAPAHHFIGVPRIEADFIEIPDPRTFAKLMRQASFCIESSSPSPTLVGMNLRVSSGNLRVAGANQKNFSIIDADASVVGLPEIDVIIPKQSIDVLAGILDRHQEGDDAARISLSPNRVVAMAGDYMATSTLIVGAFPNIDFFRLPSTMPRVQVDRKQLVDSMSVPAAYADEEWAILTLLFRDDHMIEIRSSGRSSGSASTTLPYSGEAIEEEVRVIHSTVRDSAMAMDSTHVDLWISTDPSRTFINMSPVGDMQHDMRVVILKLVPGA